ncbi:type II toxin-antitoxin system VapB family antitoxin [Sphingomonas sp. M1-B02]|uniref:type II toxin-antitoxin system VapB family antitoxin n=1 Tax=Sphingomonas sp. M1-B02 TaxID=3114300 RepID=UPI002240B350|nr:type II toxin-antitoxin system VapB family antitoxin [Sphingomonas sp. S6-11]UZK64787.1 type II toxin-antitoxin system VapB family antitoxin [Sphingomonas sp. S6-11]
MASLFIKDSRTAALVEELAQTMGTTKTEAVRVAVQGKLDEAQAAAAPVRRSAREILAEFHRNNPLPPPTGLKADKAFFDELSGDL